MPASLPCELVIARYNEDISWSRDFTNCTLTTVYEKGEPLPTGHIESYRIPNHPKLHAN